MFSKWRQSVDPRDQRLEGEFEFQDDHVQVPCRVKVVTRGLALMLALILVGLAYLSQSPSQSPVPAAIATCDRFGGSVKALVLPAADRVLYGCLTDGTLTAWNPRLSQARIGALHGSPIAIGVFAADGSRLAVMDSQGAVSLWDLSRWRRWGEIPPRGERAEALAISRDGDTLATADGFGVRLWDLTTANPSAGPQLDLRRVTSLAFATDSRTLAVGTFDGTVRLWDTAQGSQNARFRAHQTLVKSLAFSDDGRVLATSCPEEKIARLWNVGTGRLLKEFDSRVPIQTLAFAPGDRELATAGFDGAVRLWDVATGKARWVLAEHDGPVGALAFSTDGGTLACGLIGTIRLYRLDTSS